MSSDNDYADYLSFRPPLLEKFGYLRVVNGKRGSDGVERGEVRGTHSIEPGKGWQKYKCVEKGS